MDLLAVIPILTTAGTALLPALAAVLVSLLAMALRPRLWVQAARRHPLALGVAVAVVAGGGVLGSRLMAGGRSGPAPQRGAALPAGRVDWAAVATTILAQQQSGKTLAVIDARPRADVPLLLGRDFTRCFFDGGPAPAGLRSRWTFRPEQTMFLSRPLVTPERIFAAGCQSDLGGYAGLLACLDAERGTVLWQMTDAHDEPLRPFFSSPALSPDGSTLVVGQGLHTDRDCALLGIDAASGRLRWAVKTPLHIESSPALWNDLAVVGVGAIEGRDGEPTGDPGFVLAVRWKDGGEIWRHAVTDPESSPAIDARGTVYIGSGVRGQAIVALRSDAPEELAAQKLPREVWRTPLDLPATSAISLSGDLVIAGAGNGNIVHSQRQARGAVVALDRGTGSIHWRVSLDDAVLGEIAVADNLAICPCRSGEVAAIDIRGGDVRWRTRLSGSAPVLAGCALAGQRVYAVSSDGYLAVLDVGSGKILERLPLNRPTEPGTGLSICVPHVAGGRVIVGSETGGLHCLVGAEGRP